MIYISFSRSQTAAGIAVSYSNFSFLLSDAKKFFGLRGSWGFLGRAIFLPGLGDRLWTVRLQGGTGMRWGFCNTYQLGMDLMFDQK